MSKQRAPDLHETAGTSEQADDQIDLFNSFSFTTLTQVADQAYHYLVAFLPDSFSPSRIITRVWSGLLQNDTHVMCANRPADRDERIRRASFHEAGHAVLFLDSGISIDGIEIMPDAAEVGGTVSKTEPFRTVAPGSRLALDQVREILRDLDCVAAGSAAEAIAFPPPSADQITIRSDDVALMCNMLECFALNPQARDVEAIRN